MNALSRREFLRRGAAIATGAPLALQLTPFQLTGAEKPAEKGASSRSDAKVAIVQCRSYGPEVHAALTKSFDLLGGIDSLVRNKTVTVKLNLTGTTQGRQ